MSKHYHFQLPGELDELMRLAERIRGLDEYCGLPAKPRYILDLALEEMASNIIKYGLDNRSERSIEVEIDFSRPDLVLTLRDDGSEFNPLECPFNPDGDIDERPIGGVGIHLICNLAKRMDYRRTGNTNELKIVIDCSGNDNCNKD